MAIIKMQKLRMVALGSEKAELMKQLRRLGCVELTPAPVPEGYLAEASADSDAVSALQAEQARAETALRLLKQYAYEKSGLFSQKDLISDADFFADIHAEAKRAVGQILEAAQTVDRIHDDIAAKRNFHGSLALWEDISVPVELTGTKTVSVLLGSVPRSADLQTFRTALTETDERILLEEAGADRDRQGLVLLVPKLLSGSVSPILHDYGFEYIPAGGKTGTAHELRAQAAEEIETLRREQDETYAFLKDCGSFRRLIRLYSDRLTLELEACEAESRLLTTSRAFALTGWVDVPHVEALETLLRTYCCAWELTEPTEDDKVPIHLKNNALTEPLNMVTEMYSLPDYRNIDPNPLIMPFFCIFFGMMFNDLGYGLVFIALSLLVQKKYRLYGGTKYMMQLMLECGVTTALMGLITGSFFGDAIPVFAGLLGKEVSIPSLINPLEDPLKVLILSLVVGAVQILFGMGVKAYLLIRDGKPLDALFDVGSWWLLFAGIAVGALKGIWWFAIAGVAALVLTQGRAKPTIPGKLVGGLASLYDITSYFSDVLSYSRLMALMLAGGIVASIVNVLGSLFGSVILFIPIFIIGHAFNIGINVIGTYVHAARLQYLEFFGKFYQEGGKPFKPFAVRSKYFDIES